MANSVDYEVRIKAITEGLASIQALAKSLDDVAVTSNKPVGGGLNKLEKEAAGATQSSKALASSLSNVAETGNKPTGAGIADIEKQSAAANAGVNGLKSGLNDLVGSLLKIAAIAGGTALFGSLIADGIKYNSTLENTKIGIASLITAQSDLRDSSGTLLSGQNQINAAFGIAQDQLKKLQIAGLQTTATFQQLAEGFQTAVGPGLAAGLQLDDIRKLTVNITQAAGALNLPYQQLNQEIRDIFQGTINQNAQVGKALGLSTELVHQWQAQGTLAAELNKRLEVYGRFGTELANTFSGQTSNLKEARDILLGLSTSSLFDNLKNGIGKALSGAFDLSAGTLSKDLQPLIDNLNVVFGGIGKVGADALIGFVDGLKSVSQFLKDNQEQVTAIQTSFGLVFGEIGKVLGGLGDIVAALGLAGTQSGAFATSLQSVGLIVAGVRDGVSIISASFAEVGAGILSLVSTILSGISSIVGAVDSQAGGKLKDISASIQEQADKARAAVKQIDDEFATGQSAVQQYAVSVGKIGEESKRIGDSASGIKELAPAVTVVTAAAQQLQTNLQALKVDVGTLSGGVSDFAAAGIRSFTQLANNAEASGKQIRAALEGAIDTAKTVADIDALREALIHAAAQGKISGEDLVRAIESIDDAGRKAAGTIDGPLGESLKRLGIQTKGQLNELARQAEDDYRRVTKSAEVSADGQLAALNKLIAAEKAANNGRVSIELTTQKEILEARKAATEAASAEGFAVRQAALAKAEEKDANERLAASAKALAEARKQAAEAATKEQAAAKVKEQGLKDFGGVIAAIINNVEKLSSKAAAAFDSAFGIPVKNAQGSLEALQASLKKVNDEIFFNAHAADVFATSSLAGLVKFNDASNLLQKSFFEQAIQVKQLEDRLGALGNVSFQNAAAFNAIANNAQDASAGFTLLDAQQLTGLQSAIQSARDKVAAFNQDIANTVDKIKSIGNTLQDELDRARGNLAAIQQRQFEQQKKELLDLATKAGGAGVDDVNRSLALLQQVNDAKLKQITDQQAAQLASQQKTHADALAKIAAQEAIQRAAASSIVAAAPRPAATTPLPGTQAAATVTNNNTFSFVLPGGTVDQFVRQNVVPVLDSITRRSL